MRGAYYNEHDPQAAAWLRELARRDLIPAGDVDERDIRDVRPDDLKGYAQHHFFAGIGGWAYALRLADWPDDKSVCTGSCPCPPFSAAGKGSECPSCGGRSCLAHPVITAGWLCLDCGDEWRGDDRHLLPEFIRLIGECGFASVFGEQVASRDGRLWFYALRAVLERVGNAVGCADLCVAGFGAPHIRQRLFFGASRLADAEHAEWRSVCEYRQDGRDGANPGREEAHSIVGARGEVRRMADAYDAGSQGWTRVSERADQLALGAGGLDGGLAHTDGRDVSAEGLQRGGEHGQRAQDGGASWLANANGQRHDRLDTLLRRDEPGRLEGDVRQVAGGGEEIHPRPTNGFWRDADWLYCRDGKWRPVEPGAFPLAHGLPARVGRLRGYGNAISPQVGAAFVRAFEAARLDKSEPEAPRQADLFAVAAE